MAVLPLVARSRPDDPGPVSLLDHLLDANARFAATDARERQPTIPFLPNRQLYLLTCIDPRVEPADVFGLALGDAIVARTVGGRVTPAVLQDLAWISYLHEVKTPGADWFELVVVHHTDCGSALLADDGLRRDFAHRTGHDEADLAALAVLDPARTVADDVAAVIAAPQVSAQIRVSGCVYDVATGRVTLVVPPAADRAEPARRRA
jgi:carbonic anhydrase